MTRVFPLLGVDCTSATCRNLKACNNLTASHKTTASRTENHMQLFLACTSMCFISAHLYHLTLSQLPKDPFGSKMGCSWRNVLNNQYNTKQLHQKCGEEVSLIIFPFLSLSLYCEQYCCQ